MKESDNEPIVDIETSHQRSKSSSIMFKIGLILGGIYIFASILIPIILLIYPTITKHLVFMNKMKTQTNFTRPESLGIDRVHNFYLNVDSKVTLGIWHFRSPLINDEIFDDDEDYFSKHLISTIPIVIYFHGYAYDRSLTSRRELCQRLRNELKYDVITFDYRGFGDSTGEPTENGLIKDAQFIYNWLQKLNNQQRKIYLWGHALGSAVAAQLAAQLSQNENKNLGGIVLEAPFLNIHQALLTHWLSLFFRWQPWYYSLTEKSLHKNKLYFETRHHLLNLNCPCVLIHADDDFIIPYIHSKQLLQIGINARNDNKQKKKLFHFSIDMISYHRSGYGHQGICRAPKLISTLKTILFEEDLSTQGI